MNGTARKPASKFPHLRKQMQKNKISSGKLQLKTVRQKSKGKGLQGP